MVSRLCSGVSCLAMVVAGGCSNVQVDESNSQTHRPPVTRNVSANAVKGEREVAETIRGMPKKYLRGRLRTLPSKLGSGSDLIVIGVTSDGKVIAKRILSSGKTRSVLLVDSVTGDKRVIYRQHDADLQPSFGYGNQRFVTWSASTNDASFLDWKLYVHDRRCDRTSVFAKHAVDHGGRPLAGPEPEPEVRRTKAYWSAARGKTNGTARLNAYVTVLPDGPTRLLGHDLTDPTPAGSKLFVRARGGKGGDLAYLARLRRDATIKVLERRDTRRLEGSRRLLVWQWDPPYGVNVRDLRAARTRHLRLTPRRQVEDVSAGRRWAAWSQGNGSFAADSRTGQIVQLSRRDYSPHAAGRWLVWLVSRPGEDPDTGVRNFAYKVAHLR